MKATDLIVKATVRAQLPKIARYAELLRRVRETLVVGQSRIEELKVRTYWEAGRLVNEHIRVASRPGKERAYGKQVVLRLSRDLEIGDQVLYQTMRFAKAFPNLYGRTSLTWTHYRALLAIPDDKRRKALAERAERLGWTSPELEKRIRSHKAKLSGDGKALPGTVPLLEPKKGRLGLYRIVENKGILALDLGFTSYEDLEGERARNLKAGDLVTFSSAGRLDRAADRRLPRPPRSSRSGRLLKVEDAQASDLYTYDAEALRVVDGDTIWMKIWILKPRWVKEKLRLRGLDAPERGTPEGERAKRFVESLLKRARQITITSTKPDKWDRYLTDLFLTTEEGEELYLNNLLLEKGHARLKEKFSLEDWEGKR